MSDAANGDERAVRVVRRRDGARELKTPRPLHSLAAAFEALSQLSLG